MKSLLWVDLTKITDEELADLIHDLQDELEIRLRKYKGLKGQCEAASLQVRSWSTQHQQNMHDYFNRS